MAVLVLSSTCSKDTACSGQPQIARAAMIACRRARRVVEMGLLFLTSGGVCKPKDNLGGILSAATVLCGLHNTCKVSTVDLGLLTDH